MYCSNPTPPEISSNTFDNYNAKLYVPKGYTSSYYEHPYWSKFSYIGEFEPSGVGDIEAEDVSLPVEYYTLGGVKVAETASGEQPSGLAPGIYISRRGSKSAKVIIR